MKKVSKKAIKKTAKKFAKAALETGGAKGGIVRKIELTIGDQTYIGIGNEGFVASSSGWTFSPRPFGGATSQTPKQVPYEEILKLIEENKYTEPQELARKVHSLIYGSEL